MDPLKVLLVTYSFPPAGGVGVLRAASLARYFPREEIQLDVLTARNASAVGADPALLREIPAEVKIHRTVTLDLPFGIKKRIKSLISRTKTTDGKPIQAALGKPSLLKRVLGDLLLPDPQVTWVPVLKRAARRIIRDRAIDLVLITVPPFSCLLLVEDLRKRFPELPIIIDFRDEWLATAFDLVGFSRSERARRIACISEARAVANATAVVAVTESARREICARYPHELDSKFHLIPNGFDATRLQRLGTVSEPQSTHRIFVTYVGTIYTSTEPTTLIQAVRMLPLDVESRFRLRFVGHIEDPRYREALRGLGDMVELKGFMPQHEALATMEETDYVLLISHDRLNVSAKFYDYIGAGKPILACVHPDGDIRRMLEELKAGWWADVRDVEGIRQLFVEAAARRDSLSTEFQPDKEKIAQYERKVLAQRYARLLHSIVRGQNESESLTLAADSVEKVSLEC